MVHNVSLHSDHGNVFHVCVVDTIPQLRLVTVTNKIWHYKVQGSKKNMGCMYPVQKKNLT